MEQKKNIGAGLKLISVILGAMMGGFMWRCRGEGGFGSFWGLCSVGMILFMLIWNFYAPKAKMRYEMILLGALYTGLGVNGYATVIEQLAGVVWSDLPYQGEVVYSPVSPKSGLIIILLMAMTFVPLYAFFVGSLFSDKEYKPVHYLIPIVLYFGVSTLMKATLAHPILAAINPEQVEWAARGLADYGLDYATPAKAYMDHFLNRDFSQEIPYFENYFMSIDHISDVAGVISIWAYLAVRKDKIALAVSAFISLNTAVVSTLGSSMISIMFRSGFFEGVTIPRFLETGSGWGLWEYLTGASVGFGTLLILALLPKKYTARESVKPSALFNNSKFHFVFNLLLSVFMLAVVAMRAVGLRIGSLLENFGVLEDSSPTGDILMILLAIAMGIFLINKLWGNRFRNGTVGFGVDAFTFARVALPAYFTLCIVLYFFTNHAPLIIFPYGEIKSLSGFAYMMTGSEWIELTLMLVSAAVVNILYWPARKKLGKK